MVFLPEACDHILTSPSENANHSEGLNGPTMSAFKQLARDNKVWLSIGGFHEKVHALCTYMSLIIFIY